MFVHMCLYIYIWINPYIFAQLNTYGFKLLCRFGVLMFRSTYKHTHMDIYIKRVLHLELALKEKSLILNIVLVKWEKVVEVGLNPYE